MISPKVTTRVIVHSSSNSSIINPFPTKIKML
jgi:hypothetical protein